VFEHKKIRGQGLVEFAFMLPILLLLTVGALNLGVAFYVKVVMENSAREGAYFMVYHTEDGKANGFALAKDATQREGQDSGVAIPDDDIVVKCMQGVTENNDCPSGSTVVVTVNHELPLMVDIFSYGPLQMVNEARMLIP
jgi:Flp pilus assembly protein TadG